jgi:hypothetical protein
VHKQSLLLLIATFCALEGARAADSDAPFILSAVLNYAAQPPVLTITGRNFGTSAAVRFNGSPEVVIEATDNSITADAPSNLSAGTYKLVVKNLTTNLSGLFDVAYGAAGATGTSIFYTAPNPDISTPIGSTYSPLANLSLPAGSFAISAKVGVSNVGGSPVEVVCELAGGGIVPFNTAVTVDLQPDTLNVGSWGATLPLQVAITLSDPTTVSLQCAGAPNPDAIADRPVMTAIPVNSIIVQ